MKAIIVGFGKVGKMYAQALHPHFNSLIAIDPHPQRSSSIPLFSDFSSIPLNGLRSNLWIISSPTSYHLEHLEQILDLDSNAKVILEKPATSPGESGKILKLLSGFPDARICINDLYSMSPATHYWVNNMKSIRSPLKSLSIELSKNRASDEGAGRFQDFEYGVLGYEGFHLFSLLSSALSGLGLTPEVKIQFATHTPSTKSILLHTQMNHSIAVKLATSVDGQILIPEDSLESLYKSNHVKKYLRDRSIPASSEFRYRFAKATFEDGSFSTLLFEPYYGNSLSHKNLHLIQTVSPAGIHEKVIFGNQFEHAVDQHLQNLLNRNSRWREVLLKNLNQQRLLEQHLGQQPQAKENHHEMHVAP